MTILDLNAAIHDIYNIIAIKDADDDPPRRAHAKRVLAAATAPIGMAGSPEWSAFRTAADACISALDRTGLATQQALAAVIDTLPPLVEYERQGREHTACR